MEAVIPHILRFAETRTLPDGLLRAGADALVWATDRDLARPTQPSVDDFIREMDRLPVARHVGAANDQHYELPPEFFALVLGRFRKYSCGYYATPDSTLDAAEEAALNETTRVADVKDGHSILELGCGWGSLTLFLADRFPQSKVTAVSNSALQKDHIESEAMRRGLHNVRVITADINEFEPVSRFDRIVSVEMFEHLANWAALFRRMKHWLRPEARIHLHIFTHADTPYRFDHEDPKDWVARHFFTGGFMPSRDLLSKLAIPFVIEAEERWSGSHYARTARDWLRRFDENRAEIDAVLSRVYGDDLSVWINRWRLFFIATERLFGYRGGKVWGVDHYRLRPE